jgi:hypothetical protein
MLMETTKGFLADFINKKLKLQKLAVQKGEAGESADSMVTARYETALLCLMKNSRQDLKDILKLSPPHLSERQATEEFLKNVSMAADEFADEFVKAIEALSRIVLWKDNKCLDKFPDHFIPELDLAIKEIFPDAGMWGNIAWDAIVKNAEKFLSTNNNDTITLSVYSRAVTILVSQDNRNAKLFFESFRNDVIKAIVINLIQPMAHSLGDEISMDDNHRQILLEKLSLLQTSLLAA